MDTTLAMAVINRLQLRLWGALVVFYCLALAFGPQWRDCMVGCAIFGLLAIPLRVVLATIEIAKLVDRPRTGLFQ